MTYMACLLSIGIMQGDVLLSIVGRWCFAWPVGQLGPGDVGTVVIYVVLYIPGDDGDVPDGQTNGIQGNLSIS